MGDFVDCALCSDFGESGMAMIRELVQMRGRTGYVVSCFRCGEGEVFSVDSGLPYELLHAEAVEVWNRKNELAKVGQWLGKPVARMPR